MKQKYNYFLIGFALIILLGIVIWCVYKEPKSEEFNNIITPILTIIATVIYAWALINTIKQNDIILSQTIKPHFEGEIEDLLNEARGVILDSRTLKINHEIHALNYVREVNNSLARLCKDEHFLKDLESFENNNSINYSTLKERSYFGEILFLNQLITMNGVDFFYGNVKLLLEEISQSKLIEVEIELLKKKIYRKLLNEYMAFIKFCDENKAFVPKIPFLKDAKSIEYKSLSDTSFRRYYDLFKLEFDFLK